METAGERRERVVEAWSCDPEKTKQNDFSGRK